MRIEQVDELELGEINIKKYRLPQGEIRYWVRAGAALIELDEFDFVDLYTLMDAIHKEDFCEPK